MINYFLKIQAMNKWRKVVHGKKKKPFTEHSPLPFDLHISVKVTIQHCYSV